ncbi:MAG: hypothetical protein AMJ42_01785, partial [Deltaproteobacteria bacterium DG_8]
MIVKRNPLIVIILLPLFYLSYLTLIFLFPSPAYSVKLIDSDLISCELSGSLKGFYLGIHDNHIDKSHDGGLTLLRLILTGKVLEKASIEFHLLEGGMINPLPAAPSGFVSFSEATRFRADPWDHSQSTHEDFSSQIAIDRANITLRFPHCDLTLGRQAITLGTTYFWNPNDLLTAFSPYEFDREYKPGVDGAKVDIALGMFSGISFIYGAGDSFGLNESALLIRTFTNMFDFDLAMMAGRFRQDGFVG